MTAPDPGLTDLIAAHQVMSQQWFPAGAEYRLVCKCGIWMGADAFPAHVALVVEQHTNGRIAEYIKQLESERETLTSMCSELESIRDEQAARIAELETLQRVDQDLFVQTLAIANQRKERAEKAEATIARVEAEAALLERMIRTAPWSRYTEVRRSHLRSLCAALEGEQQ
ncbi:hypothetical protein [Rhodococcus qingshengii]|uniref:hypothetical protein n=1 Tax=Rhodococcus qingshengii TaxID=334542 RepID=UPI00287FA076|nr:hypothetical protein [Rhodococcus qingshengii]